MSPIYLSCPSGFDPFSENHEPIRFVFHPRPTFNFVYINRVLAEDEHSRSLTQSVGEITRKTPVSNGFSRISLTGSSPTESGPSGNSTICRLSGC
jgi:hypothetical protein